jgi:hypothetical protein
VKIYIAGPYSKGDVALNVRAAIDAWEALFQMGHVPICPHLTHFIHMIHPHKYQDWLDYDIKLLYDCDALLRLSGESSGADGEESVARDMGIPIYHSISEIPKP